jgi:hypothetical protein
LFFGNDFCIYGNLNILTNSDVTIVFRKENFSEIYFVTGITGEVGHIQVLAFLDPELLTGYLNYCKHGMPKFRSAKVWVK